MASLSSTKIIPTKLIYQNQTLVYVYGFCESEIWACHSGNGLCLPHVWDFIQETSMARHVLTTKKKNHLSALTYLTVLVSVKQCPGHIQLMKDIASIRFLFSIKEYQRIYACEMDLRDLVWESPQRPLASKQRHERTRNGNGGKNLLWPLHVASIFGTLEYLDFL